jgi:heat shock protein HtpX
VNAPGGPTHGVSGGVRGTGGGPGSGGVAAGGGASPALDADMRKRISAYPGTLTYIDLIRKNKRASAVLIVVMILMAVAIGGVIAAALVTYLGARPSDLIPSAILGCVVALVVAGIGSVWSWFGGSAAILAVSGAREITKDLDQELFNVVEELAIAGGIPMPRIYLIGDSAMNAFATGRDPQHAAVAITVGLRSKLSRDELQGVLAHELSHIRHYDTRFAVLMATMAGLIVFACDAFWRVLWYGRPGRSIGSSREKGAAPVLIALFIIAIVLAIIAPLIARLIQMAYSRRREYLADAGSVELTRNPLGLASALQKLAVDDEPLVDTANRGTAHMYIVNPLRKMRDAGQSLNSMFVSHPPIKERIARLMALAR